MPKQKDPDWMNVRGNAKINRKTGDINFRAAQPSEPIQKNVKKEGNSSFYETDGEKTSSYVCHLKVDKDSADPAGEMQEQLDKLTAGIRKKEPAAPRGKFLLNKPEVLVVHNKKQSEVTVRLAINLKEEGELSAKLFNLVSEVNKCFAINQKKLIPAT